MTYILYDLVIGIVLLLFALRGRKRGLILAVCSLAAVITAFAGASYGADLLTPKVAEVMVPKISSVIEQRIHDLDVTGTDAPGGDSSAVDSAEDDPTAEDTQDDAVGLDTVREALSALRLPSGMLQSVEESLGGLKEFGDLPALLSSAIARAAADTLLHLLVFLICFILILLLWRVIGHALDFVARLPVLHFCNKTGGFLFGTCKGIFFFFLLAWILRSVGGIVPDDAVEQTHLLRFFMTTNPLAYIAGM